MPDSSLSDSSSCRVFRAEELHLSDGKPIGSGAIAQVVQCTLTAPKEIQVAVKIVSKIQVLQQNKVKCVMNEKEALVKLNPFPFVARLYGTSQSEDELYFVMEHLPHGDLLQHIRRTALNRLSERQNICPSDAKLEVHAKGASDCSVKSPLKENNSMCTTTATETEDDVAGDNLEKKIPPCLDFHDIQLISGQLIIALAHVFSRKYVLRDLKPENIVFDKDYRACLVDFDTVDIEGNTVPQNLKQDLSESENDTQEMPSSSERSQKPRLSVSEIQAMRKKTASFCGTAQYVSPEMVKQCEWSYSSDLWALGAVIYEMVYGVHMFKGLSSYEVMQSIIKGLSDSSLESKVGTSQSTNAARERNFFPLVYLGPETDAFMRVKDFIIKLMNSEPSKRLGVHPETGLFDVNALRRHPFFSDFKWSLLDDQVALFQDPVNALLTCQTSNVYVPTPLCLRPPSLKEHYHILPFNDPAYAEYVYKATSDVNPFEKWLIQSIEKGLSEPSDKALPNQKGGDDSLKDFHGGDTDKKNIDTTPSSNQGTPTRISAGETKSGKAQKVSPFSSDPEDDDVIDDVGIRFQGIVHEDFGH